jgi:hypothetical protein
MEPNSKSEKGVSYSLQLALYVVVGLILVSADSLDQGLIGCRRHADRILHQAVE